MKLSIASFVVYNRVKFILFGMGAWLVGVKLRGMIDIIRNLLKMSTRNVEKRVDLKR